MCYDCHLWNTGINFIARLFYIHFIVLEYLNTESVEQINKQERMNFAIYSHVVRKKKMSKRKNSGACCSIFYTLLLFHINPWSYCLYILKKVQNLLKLLGEPGFLFPSLKFQALPIFRLCLYTIYSICVYYILIYWVYTHILSI